MLSTKFASQQLKKHLLECSDSFLVSPTFPLAQCLMFRPSFFTCRYKSQQHEKHCFDANLLQHRRSHDQKTKKGPQSEKTLSLPLILCRSPTLHSLDSPFLTALRLFTWETTLLRATVYSNLVLGTTAWILWMPISDDECMLLVPHRESQPDHPQRSYRRTTKQSSVFLPDSESLAAETCRSRPAPSQKSFLSSTSAPGHPIYSITNTHSGANPVLATTTDCFYCPANV